MVRQAVLLGSLLLISAGCSPLAVSPPAATPKAPYTLAPPTPILSPIATVAPTGHGRPYTAEMMALELMDVPYNFPPELQTESVAAALADQIWTYDGRLYRDLSFSGNCDESGLGVCELTVQGLPDFAPTRDWTDDYLFGVNVRSGVVTPPNSPGLEGFPPELIPELDAMARSLDTEGRVEGMSLTSVVWALPPPNDAFRLWYQKGDLEGALVLWVTLDRANRRILSMEDWVCCG